MSGTRQVVPRMARAGVMAFLAALFAAPILQAGAQGTGRGFMFHEPRGFFTMRAGYEAANTSSQPFTIMQAQTTIGPRSFDALNFGLDAGWHTSSRVDFVLSLDMSGRSTTAEYREWEEDGRPIEHTSTLGRIGFAGNLRFNLADRGRAISSLAWIPTKIVPYVGVGGGIMWYQLTQKGDFVEETDDDTAAISTDELYSSNKGALGQVFSGIDYRLTARWSFVGEARYTHSVSRLRDDYVGMGNIDLSGFVLNIGTTVRY